MTQRVKKTQENIFPSCFERCEDFDPNACPADKPLINGIFISEEVIKMQPLFSTTNPSDILSNYH